MKTLRIASASLWLALCMVGCSKSSTGSAPQDAPLTDDQNSAKTQLETQMKTAAQTAQTYHAMDNPTLLNKLVEQSAAHKEPFNSLAYRELTQRSSVDSGALAAQVKANPNASGLLPLLLLRKNNNAAYLEIPVNVRAQVLTDALQTSKNFNTWGLPHLYLEDASNAMIETGKSTVPALRRMLSDTRPAPVFGSQEYMEYKRYNYRLCDYALFFLEKIQGNTEFRMPVSVGERDALIKGLLG